MKTNTLIKDASRALNKFGFKIKKHSPEIMVITGVVGVVASAVMACKATTKVSEIIEDAKDQVEKVHSVIEDESISEEEYSVEDSKKDLAIIYAHTGIKFAKLYGPSVILGVASITSILAGHNITRKRNVALAAAYATVDKGFKEYRSRVVERFGKDLDRELKYNIKSKKIEEVVTDDNGKEKKVKKTIEVANPNDYSDYARFFDESCAGWEKDAEHNLYFVKLQQNYANDILKSRGYLFLNEVYKMLGMPVTKAGQIVGWIYDEKNPIGDNFVDFGIYDLYNEKAREFVNGYERSILLDFNVDGNILDLI